MIHPAPKPARAAPKTQKPLQRSKPIPRTSHVKRKPRPKKESLRIYGPPGYREFLFGYGCLIGRCLAPGEGPRCDGPLDPCHTENEGKSRKGHYSTQIPGCRVHHQMHDEYQAPFTRDSKARADVKAIAAALYRNWKRLEALTIAPPRAEHGK